MFEYSDLDLNLYKIFYTVYKCGNFSKAAEELGITQPAISYNIKNLETKLNIKLFLRGTSTIQLTKEAESLIPYIEEALNSIKVGEDKINELMNLKRGQVSVGIPSHIGVFLLVDIIKKFNIKYPNVKVNVTSKPTKELFRLINNNELDLLIDCSPLENTYNLEVIRIAREKCAFACNRRRKELQNRVLSLRELNDYKTIVPSKTSGNTRELEQIYNKNKVLFDPFFEVSTSDMIAEMVVKDIGVGFLFEKTIDTYEDLAKIELDITLPSSDIYMIFKKKTLSITTKKLIDFIDKNVRNGKIEKLGVDHIKKIYT